LQQGQVTSLQSAAKYSNVFGLKLLLLLLLLQYGIDPVM
jgi:hypothetical protein